MLNFQGDYNLRMIRDFPTLYKRTETGAVQIWYQQVDGPYWRSISGQIDGQKVTSEWHECFITNEGKKNERNPYQQAIFEVEANYKKRLEKDYYDSIDKIDETRFFEPMLARDYNDFAGKLKFGREKIFSQPKLDGIRCIATRDGLLSRNGKPLVSTPHIHKALLESSVFDHFRYTDGELYNHDLKADFNTIISLARKSKPTEEDLILSEKMIEYHVYDSFNHPKDTFSQRNEDLISFNWVNWPKLKQVSTFEVTSQSELDELNHIYIEQGYEGQIVRLDGPYENKRSKYLLKRKEFIDEEFPIIRIEEGLGNRSGMAGTIFIKLQDGRECGSGIAGTHEFCRQLLRERDLYSDGKGNATVRYFERTPDNVPRFPVTVAVWIGKRDL